MTPEAEAALLAHVRSIANAALLPWSAAEDVREEMLGHLVERVEAAIANGSPEPDAVQAALTEFGGAAAIGAALAETYHSRLWVSTVGVLLTAKEDTPTRPGAITGLRLLLAFQFATATAFGCIALVGATPGRAVVAATVSLVATASAVIAYRGLGIGQAWAVRFAVAAAALMVFLGLVEMSSTQAGTTTISISAIAAGIVLIWLWGSSEQVGRFVAGSRSIGRRLGVALTATLLAPVLVAGAYPNLPDPTQAGPSDVDMTLTMACGRRDLQMQDGPLLRDRQFADLTVDMLWRRSDLLPGGLGGLMGGFPAGDTAGFRIIDPPPVDFEGGGAIPVWMLEGSEPSVTVVETGEVAGWFGSTSPSVELIPRTLGSFTVGIQLEQIRSNHTIRIVWPLGPMQDGTQPWPRAEVAYAHLDRFVLIGDVTCGERARGTADRQPAPQQPGFMP